MSNDLQELLQEAAEETKRGGLVWKAFNDENFRAPIANGMLLIRREHVPIDDAEGNTTVEPVYVIEVSDDQGRVVTEADTSRGMPESPVSLFEDLFEAARKSALRPDRVIGEMLQVLRKRASEAVAPAVTSR